MNDRFEDARVESLRLPPHSVEAEQAVLGGLMLDNAALDRIGDMLVEQDFYRADHRVIWGAITGLMGENKPADVVTVGRALKEHDQTGDAGGVVYLDQLASMTPSAANIRHYAEIVRECSILRQLANVGTVIADSAYGSGGREARALLNEAEAKVLEIGKAARGARRGRRMAETMAAVMERIDELHRNPKSVTGVATGYVDLDEQLSGLQRGDLIIVGARPSMGKSALAVNIVEHVAMDLGLPALIFSLEMNDEQIGQRLLSSVAKVDSHALRTGRLSPQDWDRLGSALGKINETPIEIDDSPALSAMEIRARARRKWREYGGLGLVVVDYLQLMELEASGETQATELQKVTSALKAMAKELDCPVIALSQLNRDLEKRTNKRPVMSDLRGSGGIEQDADVIIFIYRDEVYNDESPDKGIAEIIIAKQRMGPIGTVKLTFLSRFTRFENYSGAH